LIFISPGDGTHDDWIIPKQQDLVTKRLVELKDSVPLDLLDRFEGCKSLRI
jgi:hypothetical protein